MSLYVPPQTNEQYILPKGYEVDIQQLLDKGVRIGGFGAGKGTENNVRIPYLPGKRGKKFWKKEFWKKSIVSRYISTNHLEIKRINGEIFIRDLGSEYGTLVDPHSVSILDAKTSVLLTEGVSINLAENTPGCLRLYFSRKPVLSRTAQMLGMREAPIERYVLTEQNPSVTLEIRPK